MISHEVKNSRGINKHLKFKKYSRMKTNEEVDQERNVDFKKLFFRALRYWYYFPVFLVIALVIAFAAYQTTTPLYRVSVKLLISDSGEASTPRVGVGENALPGITLGGQSNFENQAIILTSRRQVENTLRQLDFEISYYQEEVFRTQEIYQSSPFRVIIDSSEVVPPSNVYFRIEFISRDEFELSIVNGENYTRRAKFFEKITHPRFAFTIVPVERNLPGSNYQENSYRFRVNNLRGLVNEYQAKINLQRTHHNASIVEISILENNVQKGLDFLNSLAQNSVNFTLERKNQIALNTITFIEKQLIGVADSLKAAENVLEDFRSRNRVMDVSFQGQMIITQSTDLENLRAETLAKLDYYSYLKDYIQSDRDMKDVIAPAAMGIEDPVLSQLFGQLSTLNAERSALLFNATADHPSITRMNASIENLKASMIESLQSIIATTNLTLNDINKRLYNLSSEIGNLPRTEQRLLNIERNRQMNNETYTFLLTKLTEAQLAKAANMPDNEIIEEAASMGMVVPDRNKFFILIALIGVFLPILIVFLKIFLNDKVQEIDDVKELSALPVIGQLPLEKENGKATLSEYSQTMLAESFRNIRISLGYYANQKKSKTILITSTLPGEGKSFCSFNLAKSFAQLNKKTLLIEFDMRRPTLAKLCKIEKNGVGLSSFYAGAAGIDAIIHENTNIPNLQVILSGHVPPNPSELISSDLTKELLEQAQEKYDIIILDTPPLGLVADGYLLTGYADVNILIVRHNTTPKPMLKMTLRDEKTQGIPHLGILLNGIPFQRAEYSYRYGYNLKNKYFNGQPVHKKQVPTV